MSFKIHPSFSIGAPRGKYNKKYYNIIDDIKKCFSERYPKHWASIEPYLIRLETNPSFTFDILYGLVQSGKSIAALMIMWVIIIQHHYHVAFITKNRTDVRLDILSKMKHGSLPEIISKVCLKHGLTEGQKQSFLVDPVVGLSSKSRKTGQQVLPIFLMNSANNREVLKFFKSFRSLHGTHCVFVVDEVHELYTGSPESILKGELNIGEARTLLHKIWEYCKTSQASLLGITATPASAMVADPLCWVNDIYTLKADLPAPGLSYYGYTHDSTELTGTVAHLKEHNDINTIRKILQRPRVTLQNGNKEVRFIYISSYTECKDQYALLETLQEEFGDEIYAKMFVGVETAQKWDISSEHVAPTLNDFFKPEHLTDKICQQGAMILIAQKKLAAACTVKPELGAKACEREILNEKYSVTGITDQISKCAGNMEAQMQRFRLFGWYPVGHESNFWTEEASLDDVNTGIIKTMQDIIKQYDGTKGPESLAEFSSSMSTIKQVCSGAQLYNVGKRYGVSWKLSTQLPTEGVELETELHRGLVDQEQFDADHRTLRQFAYVKKSSADPQRGEDAKEARDALKAQLEKGDSAFQMPWPQNTETHRDSRYNDILKASVHPRGEESNWRVNAFVYHQDLFNCSIDQLTTIQFKETYEERAHWHREGCCANTDPGHAIHVPRDQTIWYKVSGSSPVSIPSYLVFQQSRLLKHTYIEKFKAWTPNEKYQQALDSIEASIRDCLLKKRPFRWVLYDLLKHKRPSGENASRWMSGQEKAFKKKYPIKYRECRKLYDHANRIDDAIPKISKILVEAFRPKLKLKLKRVVIRPIQPQPIPLIKLRKPIKPIKRRTLIRPI